MLPEPPLFSGRPGPLETPSCPFSRIHFERVGARTVRPNREPVIDIEAGTMTARDAKAAREVSEDVMIDRAFDRLASRISDEARDTDTSLTRARRDRDRATPRDVSHVESPRLHHDLPAGGEFRRALSGHQRKIRSATKNQVMASAPASQHTAIHSLLGDEDPAEWRRVNRDLHQAAGDAQQLHDIDRAKVQRLDRAIQAYERINDRTHRVYVAVELPDNHPDVTAMEDVPANIQPGAVIDFDQFTVAKHNLHETAGHDSERHLVLELVTSRGMYLGRSDSIEDTTHVLPRGMRLEVVSASHEPYATPDGFNERLILQLRECQ